MVDETSSVLKLCTMISVCCVVQITLLCPNFKINTDTIGFFVTHPLTMILILDFYSLYGVVYKAFVGNKKEMWEDQLTTLTCKMESLIFNVFFVCILHIQKHSVWEYCVMTASSLISFFLVYNQGVYEIA